MQVHTFLAESVADAVAQIRDTLGPEAVVLNVRRLPVEGLARLWQKPRIEVLAHVPETAPIAAPASQVVDEVQVSALAELRAEMQELRANLSRNPQPPAQMPAPTKHPEVFTTESAADRGMAPGDWRIGALLEQTGMLPMHAERVVSDLCARFGEAAPVSLAEEIAMAREVLAARWKSAATQVTGVHVFIGAPGTGKTTALCKWLAQVSLVEGRSAAVWRLDGHVANTAESLSVFAEILGVPVGRCFPTNDERPDVECLFVDLPGVNPHDAAALEQLRQRLALLPDAQVHLVVNAAYETAVLQTQVRAFAAVPVHDVIVTHLDEEPRGGKLWNLVLGTNCTVRFLGAGQNIPGEFIPATAEEIFARQFPQKAGFRTAQR